MHIKFIIDNEGAGQLNLFDIYVIKNIFIKIYFDTSLLSINY